MSVKINNHKLFLRISYFVIGLMLFAFGISVTIIADFDISPWDALSVGLYDSFHLTIGTWMNVTSLLLIVLGGLLRHERPKISCMITSCVMSAFVDLFTYMMQGIVIEFWYLKAILFLIGVLIISMGCGTYLIGEFAPCPIDYFMIALRDGLNTNIRKAMTICEGSGFVLAYLVSGPIGLGTVLSVFIYGPLIQFFNHLARNTYHWLLCSFPEVVHNAVDI